MVIGGDRSGSQWVKNLIAQHKDIYCFTRTREMRKVLKVPPKYQENEKAYFQRGLIYKTLNPLKINYSHHLISVRKDLRKFELGSYIPLNQRVRKPYGFSVGHIVHSCS